MQNNDALSFELLIKNIIKEEFDLWMTFLKEKDRNESTSRKSYLTIKEISDLTGIGTYTLRQLTYARAMPHLLVKSRIIFDHSSIADTIAKFIEEGWSDPDKMWDVKKVQEDIRNFSSKKENQQPMIDEIIRNIIKEELAAFSEDILKQTKKSKESYYGRTILTIKEAAEYFRTSTSTIYSLVKEDGMPHLKIQSRFYIVMEEAEAFLWRETAKSYATSGNVYWQRLLQRLDWEEKEREIAYQNALKRYGK
ncbi:helix-turn-helix domain-containing protein [Paenibacillus sp. MBLB2552]|uniref:Helix-turn-helix domain-containing protein n=1 Tax=Paenibacillus mellifer TaxID=2937794 RepID=A0A9X1XY35_9BACL|nr:helix-turn-helix domain-containing protein [Paenibacillus mellifer]MCK8487003.1 helix-turn-helix domain-containing protein [Paenibacillus mellifer]